MVGTTIFGTLDQNPDPQFRIIAGLISLAGVVLSSLQTSLGFEQIAERHRAVAAQYRSIKRRLELFSLKYTGASADKRTEAIAELEALNRELAELAPEGPNLADKYFDRAEKDYEIEHQRTSAQQALQAHAGQRVGAAR